MRRERQSGWVQSQGFLGMKGAKLGSSNLKSVPRMLGALR